MDIGVTFGTNWKDEKVSFHQGSRNYCDNFLLIKAASDSHAEPLSSNKSNHPDLASNFRCGKRNREKQILYFNRFFKV